MHHHPVSCRFASPVHNSQRQVNCFVTGSRKFDGFFYQLPGGNFQRMGKVAVQIQPGSKKNFFAKPGRIDLLLECNKFSDRLTGIVIL